MERIRLVSGFLRELTEVIEFGANAEGAPVLAEMQRMRELLDRRKLKVVDINASLCEGHGGGWCTASRPRRMARWIRTRTCSAC